MKVLKVSQIYYPYVEKGGPVVKIKALAEHLARRGHGVTVLTANLGHRAWPARGSAGAEEHPSGAAEVIYLPTVARYRTSTLNPAVVPFCLRRLRSFDV